MNRNGETMARGPGEAMTRPLLWSAAGHLLALSACIVLGTGGGPELRLAPVVEVVLVAGEPASGGAPASGAARAGPPRARGSARPAGEAVAAPPPPGDRSPDAVPARPASTPPAAPAMASAGPAPRPAPRPVVVVPPARVEAGPAPGAGEAAAVAASGPAAPGAAAWSGSSAGGAAGEGVPRGAPIASIGGRAGAGLTGSAEAGPPPQDGGAAAGAAGSLGDYIRSRIVYPVEARRRGLEGVVTLSIRIEPGGVPKDILVARSSGTRLLDDAAWWGVVAAAPLPARPGLVEVQVRFRLE